MLKHFFSSFEVREFKIFWFVMFFSLIGTWIQSMAQSWLVFDLTHSSFLLGLVGFLSYLPISLFVFAAGVLVDRTIKRNLLIFTQTTFMLLAFVLALLVHSDSVRVWHIFVIAFLNGILLAFDAPARQSMVVELVGRQHILNAIALNSASFSSARFIGTALAGVFIASIGLTGCFFINAFSYVPVIFALFLIKPRVLSNVENGKSFRNDFKEVFVIIKNNYFMASLLGLIGVISIFGVSYIVLMPVFAEDILDSGAVGFALLLSANGLGALAGALNLARLKNESEKLKILKISILIFLASVILFSFSRSLYLSIFLLMLVGFGGTSAQAAVNTLLQLNIKDEQRGRLTAVFMMMFIGLMPLGNLLSGFFAHFIGAPLVVCFGGIVSLLFYVFVVKKHLDSSSQEVSFS